MNRYRRGWFGDSHRHYLAAKGIKTKRYFYPTTREIIRYVEAGVKPIGEEQVVGDFNQRLFEEELRDRGLVFVAKELPVVEGVPSVKEYFFTVPENKKALEYVDKIEKGELFGYPESARKGFDHVVGNYDGDDLTKVRWKEAMDLMKEGVTSEDLDYLEFIPDEMDAEEVKEYADMRRKALGGLLARKSTWFDRVVPLLKEGYTEEEILSVEFPQSELAGKMTPFGVMSSTRIPSEQEMRDQMDVMRKEQDSQIEKIK